MIKATAAIVAGCIWAVAGCGGGSDSPPAPPPVTTTHRIQLGPVSGSRVRVLTPDQATVLYDGTTDADGYFKLEPSTVRAAWENLPVRPDFVWIIASGGVDTDPNDDGIKDVGEAVSVRGEVRGIVPIARLLNEANIRVSLLSTAIADVLGDTKDLTEERIVDVARQLQFPDIDRDGKVTISDVLFYEMGSNSGLENSLRSYYLNAIHKGDSATRQQYVSSTLIDFLPIRIERMESGELLNVKLFKLGNRNTIYYGNQAPTTSLPLISTYADGMILTLTKGQKVFFRECTPALECSQTQVVLWDGTSPTSFVAAPGGLIGNVYQDTTYIDGLKRQLDQINTDFAKVSANIAITQTAIATSDSEISTLQQQITDIDAEIQKLKDGG